MPTPPRLLDRRACARGLAAGLLALAGGAHAEGPAGSWAEHAGGTVVRGSGNVVTEPRTIGPFQAIDLKGGGMNIVVRPASKEALEVRADDNLLPVIETVVAERNGVPTLEIGTRRGVSFTSRTRVNVTVDVVTLKSLAISGSGDIQADGIKAGDLKGSISGSGTLRLRRFQGEALALNLTGSGAVDASGRVATLAVAILGSGDIAAREVDADEVTIRIAGSGNAAVNAHKTLSVSIAGSGDVEYAGDPVVRTSIAGRGAVRRR